MKCSLRCIILGGITGAVTVDHLLQMSTHVYADKLLFFLSKLVSYGAAYVTFHQYSILTSVFDIYPSLTI